MTLVEPVEPVESIETGPSVAFAVDHPRTPGQAHVATPYLVLDVAVAVERYRRLAAALPGTAVHYAVKANPDPVLLAALARAGSRFDVASPAEVRAALSAGARAADLVYSNPVKKRSDILSAAFEGVRLFVVDSLEETMKVAAAAPRASVLVRLLTSGAGSDWSLSRKYGCSEAEALSILMAADRLGLDAAGLSFHVGSQQRDPDAWNAPIETSAAVFRKARSQGLELRMLDLGGGFPAALEGPCPALATYGEAVESALSTHFGHHRPHTLIEPGRAVVGDAGVLVASVIAVLNRGSRRWVYLDVGVFTGLVETLDEAIRYPVRTSADGGPTGPCVLAGPTCDSADVLYEQTPIDLPLSLAEGDTVQLLAAGAYTSCYSTVGFNGFAPLGTVLCE